MAVPDGVRDHSDEEEDDDEDEAGEESYLFTGVLRRTHLVAGETQRLGYFYDLLTLFLYFFYLFLLRLSIFREQLLRNTTITSIQILIKKLTDKLK